MTITVTASGISLDGPLVAGEVVAVSVSGVTFAEEDKPTLALLARFPDALLASVELAESETAGTWTGELDTATKQTALFFATARADERRDAVLELVAGRVSIARLTVPMANSALCPKPDGSPFASPVYVPVPGPPGTGGDPYEQNPEMDGAASPGTSDEYARGDHRHPTDTTRQAVIEDLAAIRTGATAGATAVQPSALAAVATTGDYADLNNKPTIPSAYGPFTAREEAVASQTREQTSYGKGGAATSDGNGNTWSSAFPNNNGTLALQEGIAPAFSASSTYAVGDYVTHEGLLYKCTTAVTTAGAWNAANWTPVAVTDEMGGGGGGLPYDAEVEYILATDGQYIDTGIAANTITAADGVVSTSRGTKSMFGARDGAGSNMLYFGYYTTNVNGLRLSYGSSTDGNKVSSSHLSGFVSLGWNQSSMWYGDNSTSVSLSGSVTSRNAYLFTFNNGGTPLTGETTTMAIRSFRILGANGEVLRDYIAVRKNGVGYLYDRVSGALFGNDGTGAFSFGSDLNNLRYSFTSPTPSVSGTSATVACEDRAINDFTVATGITSLTITPPAAVTGRARDFFFRVTLTDSSLPTVTLSGGTIDIGATEVAGMTQGVNLLMFTEISSGHWLASRRSAS